MHEIQGDAYFADRAEQIAYNSLPSVGTKDLWSRVYLQQANEVFAGHSSPHAWATDGDDALTYSLQDNYECCTANFNQGWPRLIQHMLHTSPDGGIAVSILGPVNATLPSGVSISVTGDYPFEDDVRMDLSGLPEGPLAFPLYIRIPSWATGAALSVNGRAPQPVGNANGTMLRIPWLASDTGPSATVLLATNPAVRTLQGYNGALSVYRGALLYALRLDETFQVTARNAVEPRCADYIVSQPACDLKPTQPTCAAPWNVALVVAPGAPPEGIFSFARTGPTPPVPFAAGLWGGSNLELTAPVVQVAAWGLDRNAAGAPPASPVVCSSSGGGGGGGNCSSAYLATFVPYGATHLRMAVLPTTTPPPCGSTVGFNASALSAGGAGDFALDKGASIVNNGPLANIRSGDPEWVGWAAWLPAAVDSAHSVEGVKVTYEYVAGYGGDGAPGGAVVQVLALARGACDALPGDLPVVQTLYTSPPLVHYPYDVCSTCYSPPQVVEVHGLGLNATQGLVFAIKVTNNQRNVQLKLPLPMQLFWA